MEGFERHPDDEVNRALMRLCDCLCMWERNTGRTSALVLREKPEYSFRAASGKPGVPDFINDSDFIFAESGQNEIKEEAKRQWKTETKNMDKTAQKVLELMIQGKYTTVSGSVYFNEEQKRAEEGTKLYTPTLGKQILEGERGDFTGNGIHISVTEETTQGAAHRLIVKEHEKNLVLLNFASARNPGGGFLKGSQAQEEDLCMCSGLYNCLKKQPDYYSYNRSRETPLYSDSIIYSPNVPWFRKNRFEKPNDLFLASVITSPAPNAGHLNRFKDNNLARIEETLQQRAGIILAIAERNNHRNLILGAWGCGVFRNSPSLVAEIFKEWLNDQRFAFSFDHVTFAIYCPGQDKSTFEAFQERFKKKE